MSARRLVAFGAAGALALSLSLGCVVPPTKASPKPPKSSASPARNAVSPRPAPGIIPPAGPTRLVETGVPMELTGKVKVLSDYGVGLVANNGGNVVSGGGARVISNNGGGVLSDYGVGLIGDKGGGLVSNNGGGIVSNNGGRLVTPFFQLAQARPSPQEDLLADAQVEVLDAAGRTLVGADGRPLVAISDRSGSYVLTATLPAENLILRVRLASGGELRGGELTALVANQAAGGALPVVLDTASSLAASYVLSAYVQGRQPILDRLPRAENDALTAGMEAARALLPLTVPVYSAEALAAATEALRKQDAPLSATLDRIEAILLAGQANLGEGLQATSVPLSAPLALATNAKGELFVAESVAGRIRKVGLDGAVSLFAGAGLEVGRREKDDAFRAILLSLVDLVATPEGGFLIAESDGNQVREILPDGRVRVVAGTGVAGRGAPGGKAVDTPIHHPACVVRAPDGRVLIGEDKAGSLAGRLLTVDAAGLMGEIPIPAELLADGQVSGLAFAPDGTLFAATGAGRTLLARGPDGSWSKLADGLAMRSTSHIVAAPAGGVYLSETLANRVLHIGRDGQVRVLAGAGQAGYAGDGGPAAQAALLKPAGLALLADGRLAFADSGNMVIRAFKPGDPQAPITTIVGTDGVVQQGQATAIAVNSPGGLAVDAQDRVVVAEVGGSTIKRLEGGKATLLAGSSTGHADGPALAAAFNTPGGLAYGPDGSLWILDTVKPRLRRLRPDGVVETAAGTGEGWASDQSVTARSFDAMAHTLGRPLYVTVGPDERPYWTDNALNLVLRLRVDGQIDVVAGRLPAIYDKGAGLQDGPATEALFNRPGGLVFDAAGDLYVADSANMCIRKITRPGAADAVVTTIAGQPAEASIGLLLGGDVAQPDGTPGDQAVFLGPLSLAFDAEGRLYVGEVGTKRLDALANLPLLANLPTVTPSRVRRIDLRDPRRPVATVVGPGSRVLADEYGDGALGLPTGLAFDRAGRLIVADGTNNQLKLIPKAAL